MSEAFDEIMRAVGESLETKQRLFADTELLQKCAAVVDLIVEAYGRDNKVLFCGNGGSAADAQHLSAELSGRYAFDRPPLNAEALHVNTSYITAVGNDYGYDVVYSRLIDGVGRAGDVLIALSTSGNSANVVLGARQAHARGMSVVSLTGKGGGALAEYSDILLDVPTTETPRIQECHGLLGHAICGAVEEAVFGHLSPANLAAAATATV